MSWMRRAGTHVWRSCPTSCFFVCTGPKASNSRWFSWKHAHTFAKEFGHTTLLVFVCTGVKRNVFRHWTGVRAASLCAKTRKGTASGSNVLAVEVAASGLGDANVDDKPQGNKFIKHLHKVTVWMADNGLKQSCDIIYHVTQGECDDHSPCTSNATSADAILELRVKWATWKWLLLLGSAVKVLAYGRGALSQCGIIDDCPTVTYGMMQLSNPPLWRTRTVSPPACGDLPQRSSPQEQPTWCGTAARAQACWLLCSQTNPLLWSWLSPSCKKPLRPTLQHCPLAWLCSKHLLRRAASTLSS